MTKKQIDKAFVECYETVLKVAKDTVRRKRANYAPETVLTNAYLELLEKSDKLLETVDVERFVKQFIKMEVSLQNSKTNRTERVRMSHIETEEAEKILGVEDWRDFEEKLEEHNRENEAGVLIELYRSKPNNAINGHVFNLYSNGCETCRVMASELNVSRDSAARLIKAMKQDVRSFASTVGSNF